MARDKKIYKTQRRAHGEGQAKFCTVNLKEDIAIEFKLLVKAYSEIYGQKMTPTQVIKRLMNAGVKRCDPDVYEVFSRLKEEVTPEPILEITHPVDPTEGEVWNMRYFFEKDGEEIEAYIGDRTTFFCHYLGKNVGISTMIREGWKLYNDAGVEIMKEQAIKIRDIIKKRK